MTLAVHALGAWKGLEAIEDAQSFVRLDLPAGAALRPPKASGTGATDLLLEPGSPAAYVLGQLAPQTHPSLWGPLAYVGCLRQALEAMEREAQCGAETSRRAGLVLARQLGHFDSLEQSRQALLQG